MKKARKKSKKGHRWDSKEAREAGMKSGVARRETRALAVIEGEKRMKEERRRLAQSIPEDNPMYYM